MWHIRGAVLCFAFLSNIVWLFVSICVRSVVYLCARCVRSVVDLCILVSVAVVYLCTVVLKRGLISIHLRVCDYLRRLYLASHAVRNTMRSVSAFDLRVRLALSEC